MPDSRGSDKRAKQGPNRPPQKGGTNKKERGSTLGHVVRSYDKQAQLVTRFRKPCLSCENPHLRGSDYCGDHDTGQRPLKRKGD